MNGSRKSPKTYVPCPLEDQDILLEAKLDDGNILLIARVLKIKPYEPLLFIRPFNPSVQLGKIARHHVAVVGVDDTKHVAMYGNIPLAIDWIIHGGDGKKRGRTERRSEGDEQRNGVGPGTVAVAGHNFPTRGRQTVRLVVPVHITDRD